MPREPRPAPTALCPKLGVVSGTRLLLGGEVPAGFVSSLAPLPDGVQPGRWPDDHLRGPADVIVYFTRSAAALTVEIVALGAALKPTGGLWVAYPKKGGRPASDLDEEVVRSVALPIGLVDARNCTLDGTWSALRLNWRKGSRPK